MAEAKVETVKLIAAGVGTCTAGDHPNPPLDDYPLLAWTKDHGKFGYMVVHLEDQKASVEQIALALSENSSYEAVASKFGTSADHVDQAARYASEAVSLAK